MMSKVFIGYNIGCKLENSLKCQFDKWFASNLQKKRMPAVGLVRLALHALITLRWRYK